MSGRRFSTEKYAGANVAFPTGMADRLVDVARAELAAQLVFVDDDEDPARVLERWLAGKQTIPMPGPHAEPGDLLVKTARAETWTFTVHGWRELAPLELQTDPAGTGEPAAYAETDLYWGKSVVEDELDRIRAETEVGEERLDERLLRFADTLFAAIDIIRDRSRHENQGRAVDDDEDAWTLNELHGLAYGYQHAARMAAPARMAADRLPEQDDS